MQQGYNPFGDLNSGDQSFGARHPYLEEGDYKLLVKRCSTRGRSGKSFFVAEVEVLESNVPSRPAGITCSYFVDLSNIDTRGRHMAGFLASVFGVDPGTLKKDSTTTPWDGRTWTEYAGWSVSEANPLAGRKVGCRVQEIAKKDGDPFSLHTFSPYETMIIPAVRTVTPKVEPAPADLARMGVGGGAPGFMAPPPMPGAAPQGFGPPAGFNPAAAGAAGPAPLGGFAPPPAPAPVPQEQWLVHPQNPAYEYNPATSVVRARQAAQMQQAPMPPQGQGGPWG